MFVEVVYCTSRYLVMTHSTAGDALESCQDYKQGSY